MIILKWWVFLLLYHILYWMSLSNVNVLSLLTEKKLHRNVTRKTCLYMYKKHGLLVLSNYRPLPQLPCYQLLELNSIDLEIDLPIAQENRTHLSGGWGRPCPQGGPL